MKMLVETKGSYMLFNPNTGETCQSDRPSVLAQDAFAEHQFSIGNLKVFARDLPDEVTDQAWVDWVVACDDDLELALPSFLAQFGDAELVAEVQARADAALTAKAEARAVAKAEKAAADAAALAAADAAALAAADAAAAEKAAADAAAAEKAAAKGKGAAGR